MATTILATPEELAGARAEIAAEIGAISDHLAVLREVPVGQRDWAETQAVDQRKAALVEKLIAADLAASCSAAGAAGDGAKSLPIPAVDIHAPGSGMGLGEGNPPPQPLLRVTAVMGFGNASKAALVDKVLGGPSQAKPSANRIAVVVAQHLPDGAVPSPHPADLDRERCFSRGGQMVIRPEQPRQPNSQAEEEEMEAEALMGGVPLRVDLVEEFCRIAKSGDYDAVILQCGATSDPGSVAAAFQSRIPAGFLDELVPDAAAAAARLGGPINMLADLASLEGVVTIVDAERFWSSWNSLSTMQDDPMGDAPDDEDARSHVSMFAEQIEAAGMVVVAGTQTEVGAKAAESICTAVRALNPAGVIVNLEAVAADAVMAAPGRDHFLMLGGGWTPGQGSQDDAGVTWMRQRDDVDPADATAAMAPAVGGGFVYTRRTPFHPTRFHDWCERYFFTQAAQHEHGADNDNDDDEGDKGGHSHGDELGNGHGHGHGHGRGHSHGHGHAECDGDHGDHGHGEKDEGGGHGAGDAGMGDDGAGDLMATRAKMKAGHDASWQAAQTGQLLRTKGVCWIAGYHGMAISLEQMGAFIALDLESPWFDALRKADWPEIYPDVDVPLMTAACAEHLSGDRRIELEVLGHRLSQATFEAELDACLLTPAELEKLDGPTAMAELEDPFHIISKNSKLLHAAGPIDLGQDGDVDTAVEEVPGFSFVR